MEIYLVGGAVRDTLLGKDPRDKDYVVIGGKPEDFLKLGYQKVGISFPIFLDPATRDEFSLSDSLKEDLARRDLTINAMAMSQDGRIIDPFAGAKDLTEKILRHVSPKFSEDPLRIYRVARFKSQFPDFSLAPETLELMIQLAQTREFRQLSTERIFTEFKRALSAQSPSEFFRVLQESGALKVHFSELRTISLKQIDKASDISQDVLIRFAALMYELTAGDIRNFCERLFVPNEWQNTALVLAGRQPDLTPEGIIATFYQIDAFRKPFMLCYLIEVLKLKGMNMECLNKYFEQAKSITIKNVKNGLSGREIGEEIKNERIKSLRITVLGNNL